MTTKTESLWAAKLLTLLAAIVLWFVVRQKSEPWHGGVLFPTNPLPAQHEQP